jgi:hypothetical protein
MSPPGPWLMPFPGAFAVLFLILSCGWLSIDALLGMVDVPLLL